MPLQTKSQLISGLSAKIDGLLAAQLLDEYESLESRFVLGDWGPTELDAGQFLEILSRALYQIDSGNISHRKSVNDCLSYIEDSDNKRIHSHQPRSDLLHLARVVRTIYKFRSDRGAVHISPNYGPNHMDSRLVVECARWCLAEILRLFWNEDRNIVAKTIREILRFDTPCVGFYGERIIVQRTDLSVEEEVLVLLHHAGEEGMSRTQIGRFLYADAPSITRAISKLASAELRQIIDLGEKLYVLTDLGAKRVREQLGERLRLQEV